MEGIGLKKDLHAAFEWFKKAAEQNDSLSNVWWVIATKTGLEYQVIYLKLFIGLKSQQLKVIVRGNFVWVGVEKDIDEAQRLFGLAAAKNHGKEHLYLLSLLNKP